MGTTSQLNVQSGSGLKPRPSLEWQWMPLNQSATGVELIFSILERDPGLKKIVAELRFVIKT